MAKARSPPARSACFPHPVRRKPPGRSVAAQEAPLEIYNDQVAGVHSGELAWGVIHVTVTCVAECDAFASHQGSTKA